MQLVHHHHTVAVGSVGLQAREERMHTTCVLHHAVRTTEDHVPVGAMIRPHRPGFPGMLKGRSYSGNLPRHYQPVAVAVVRDRSPELSSASMGAFLQLDDELAGQAGRKSLAVEHVGSPSLGWMRIAPS